MSHTSPLVLVTGASGYVGGRLVPALLAAGARVRAGGRSPDAMENRPWAEDVELAELDLADGESVRRALEGVDAVVFLVHAMSGGRGYSEREAQMATILRDEAAAAHVGRIVYLSGLHPDVPTEELSEHMASRERVAEILSSGSVPVAVLQAATVIGGGSASFEIIRHLADVLPVMPAPSWVTNRIEPIAIDDVLHYLVAAVTTRTPIDGAFAVGGGGSDLRFADLLTIAAEEAGLARRRVLGLPVPAARLSGLWIALVTPVPRAIAMPLAESMQHDAVSYGNTIDEVLDPPPGGPTPYREAVRRAVAPNRYAELADLEHPRRALGLGAAAVQPSDPAWAGIRRRTIEAERVAARPHEMPERLRRLLGARSPLLTGLADGRDAWTLEAGTAPGTMTLHRDDRREGRMWLSVSAEPGTGDAGAGRLGRICVRLVGVPEGVRGRMAWLAHRPTRARAVAVLADALADGLADRRGSA